MNTILFGIGAGAIAVVGIIIALFTGKRMGKKDAANEAKVRDSENADDIRNRVERNAAGRVREFEDRGYRD